MATFLTTRRMAPALAARIEASVRGERGASPDAARSIWRPRLVALARFGAIAAIVGLVCAVVVVQRRERRELEQSRAALLESLRAASASVTPRDLESVARVEALLEQASGAYEGDRIGDGLRAPDARAFAAVLARPAVYVRGTTGQMNNPAGIATAAAASLKDSFLVCLVEPPASRAESVLLPKVHEAFSNAAEQHSRTVRRFRDAQAGLPYLLPAWAERVRSAKAPEDLEALRDELAKAPLDRATRAVKAELLVYAMDEEGDAKTPSELDGERAHAVRVGVVDLTTGAVLLRLRKRVDPSWISAPKRPMYATGLDGCALAFDVRESVAR